VWAVEEYEKLPRYDEDTPRQPTGVFTCHLFGRDNPDTRVCGGWAGCHDGDHLLALRMALVLSSMTAQAVEATRTYVSPVALFSSGAEAAAHGMAAIEDPDVEALMAMAKVERVRNTRQGLAQRRSAVSGGAATVDGDRGEPV
jgi:hypothetical protein